MSGNGISQKSDGLVYSGLILFEWCQDSGLGLRRTNRRLGESLVTVQVQDGKYSWYICPNSLIILCYRLICRPILYFKDNLLFKSVQIAHKKKKNSCWNRDGNMYQLQITICYQKWDFVITRTFFSSICKLCVRINYIYYYSIQFGDKQKNNHLQFGISDQISGIFVFLFFFLFQGMNKKPNPDIFTIAFVKCVG